MTVTSQLSFDRPHSKLGWPQAIITTELGHNRYQGVRKIGAKESVAGVWQ